MAEIWAIYEAFLLKWEKLIETLRSGMLETFLPYTHLSASRNGNTGKLMMFAVVLSMGLIYVVCCKFDLVLNFDSYLPDQ